MSLKTRTDTLRHTYPSLHRLPSFLSPPPSASSLLQGSQQRAPPGGEDSRASVLLSVLCVSCLLPGRVSLLPASVRSPRVPGSGCVSVRCGGGRDVLCPWQCRARLPRCSTNTPCLPRCLPSASQEHLPSSSQSQALQSSGIQTLGCFTAKFLSSTPHQNTPFSKNSHHCFPSLYF